MHVGAHIGQHLGSHAGDTTSAGPVQAPARFLLADAAVANPVCAVISLVPTADVSHGISRGGGGTQAVPVAVTFGDCSACCPTVEVRNVIPDICISLVTIEDSPC